jgi:hypothetical protein
MIDDVWVHEGSNRNQHGSAGTKAVKKIIIKQTKGQKGGQ